MVRGINKRVVEVVDMEHEYFERAILFVKEEQREREDPILRQEAGRYIRGLRYRPGARGGRMKRWALTAFKLGSAAAAGAAIMSMIRL